MEGNVRSLLVLLAIFLGLSNVSNANSPPVNYSGLDIMNGYRLKDFSGFESKWKLVTVRFRKDTQELRWVFANDLAYKTLIAGKIDYPDGAVFAKIGVLTNDDPEFPSSAVPSGTRRFQLMVRNAKKHEQTGGWGYALFDFNGKTFEEDPTKTSMACYACHRVVENRGQVFSQPFALAGQVKPGTVFLTDSKGFKKISFVWKEIDALPANLRKLIPAEVKKVRILNDSYLSEHLFQGTLDEIKPSLEMEAYLQKAPAVLFSQDQLRFSAVIPQKMDGCIEGKSFMSVSTLPRKEGESETKLYKRTYCNP